MPESSGRKPATDPLLHAPQAVSVLAYIGLGANLGDPRAAVTRAILAIAALPGLFLTRQSALYGSAPVDAGGGDYVNAVVEVQTALTPHALLAKLQSIESAAGRERPYRNAPRTLDLDVLLYDQLELNAAVSLGWFAWAMRSIAS